MKRGYITCEVTGPRQYSNDLPQGGLEVPCRLTFTGTGDDTSKVEKLLNCAPINNAIFSQSVTPACQLSEPASKRQRIDVSNPIIIASGDDVKTENSDEKPYFPDFLLFLSFFLLSSFFIKTSYPCPIRAS